MLDTLVKEILKYCFSSMAVGHSSVGAVQGRECKSYLENILKLILVFMFVVNYMRTEYCTFLHRAQTCLAEQGAAEVKG